MNILKWQAIAEHGNRKLFSAGGSNQSGSQSGSSNVDRTTDHTKAQDEQYRRLREMDRFLDAGGAGTDAGVKSAIGGGQDLRGISDTFQIPWSDKSVDQAQQLSNYQQATGNKLKEGFVENVAEYNNVKEDFDRKISALNAEKDAAMANNDIEGVEAAERSIKDLAGAQAELAGQQAETVALARIAYIDANSGVNQTDASAGAKTSSGEYVGDTTGVSQDRVNYHKLWAKAEGEHGEDGIEENEISNSFICARRRCRLLCWSWLNI